jgi:hypothetical protein
VQAEERPELRVIAAGSLLEFMINEAEFSMPVGRVSFLNIEPMGFVEYLVAHDQMHCSIISKRGSPRMAFPNLFIKRPTIGFIDT